MTLSARGHRWRLRTGAWRLAERAAEAADDGGADEAAGGCDPARRPPFDVIVASGLLSLPDLIVALGQQLSPAAFRVWPPPSVVVMHENQAAYPAGPGGGDERDAHLVLTNLATILAADAVAWNSEWNRRSFADAWRTMRRLDPDPSDASEPGRIASLGEIIWPAVEDPGIARAAQAGTDDPPSERDPMRGGGAASGKDAVRVVWPHRWEHDKGPEELLELARSHRDSPDGPPIRWILLGERYPRVPTALEMFRREFAADIEHDGWIEDPEAYRRRLASCDWVLSTARHEFFGIAVVEAMLAGCLPWLPDRLSYPELITPTARTLEPPVMPSRALAESVRAGLRAHLADAVAPRAVAKLEDLVERTVAARD